MDHTSIVWDVRMWKNLLKFRYNLLCVYTNFGENIKKHKKDKQHNILAKQKYYTFLEGADALLPVLVIVAVLKQLQVCKRFLAK